MSGKWVGGLTQYFSFIFLISLSIKLLNPAITPTCYNVAPLFPGLVFSNIMVIIPGSHKICKVNGKTNQDKWESQL